LESSIPSRTRTALAWNTAGVAVKTTLGFVRFVLLSRWLPVSALLSRWLPVSAFGLMATSQAITGITLPIAVLGSAGAYLVLHKSANSAEERALQDSFFFLRISLLGLWVLICGLIALLFLPPTERWVLVSLAVIRAVADVSLIPKIIEVGKLETQKQSLSMVGESLVYLLIGLPIAWLLANRIANCLVMAQCVGVISGRVCRSVIRLLVFFCLAKGVASQSASFTLLGQEPAQYRFQNYV